MRILGIGEYCDLGDMYFRLATAGHEVRVHIQDPASHDVFGGMLERTAHWQNELGWLRAAGENGIAVFESATQGETQDTLRRDGFQVIGGSAFGDRLEGERDFGQRALRGIGLPTAATRRFTDFDVAMDFVARNRRRYVFKINGVNSERTRNYVGEMADGTDMLAFLSLQRSHERAGSAPDFILMDYLQGVEVGVGAYFNGEAFLDAVCLDWEHKRFFNADLGELTGEMGTIVTYRGADAIFGATLGRMAPQLREGGYCGYINLNLIANADGLWPLEFTSRFGYPGFAICDSLHLEPWDSIFRKMLSRQELAVQTSPGYAAGVVLTVPPFPYRHGYEELSKGAPICFRDMTAAHRNALHFAEVAQVRAHLVTSGTTGYVGVATGTGDSVDEAARNAYEVAHKVVVPNLRFRTDIGAKVIREDLPRLRELRYVH